MYCKRVLIFNVTDNRFAIAEKQLCGMVKLVNNGEKFTSVSVFVTNANVRRFGEWWVLLSFGKKFYSHCLSTLNNEVFKVNETELDNVGCLLVKREDKCYVVCEAYTGSPGICDGLRRNASDLIAKAENGETETSATPYEKFVASTENFYGDETLSVEKLKENADSKYKSVEEYSSAFERYYAAGRGDNYYRSVRNEISRLFLEFPPYYPLIEKYPQSFFVRIDFPSSDKYFVLGILQHEGSVRYICYGLPGGKEGFTDKDFVYVDNNPSGFWMLFQDAETGQITTLSETA